MTGILRIVPADLYFHDLYENLLLRKRTKAELFNLPVYPPTAHTAEAGQSETGISSYSPTWVHGTTDVVCLHSFPRPVSRELDQCEAVWTQTEAHIGYSSFPHCAIAVALFVQKLRKNSDNVHLFILITLAQKTVSFI